MTTYPKPHHKARSTPPLETQEVLFQECYRRDNAHRTRHPHEKAEHGEERIFTHDTALRAGAASSLSTHPCSEPARHRPARRRRYTQGIRLGLTRRIRLDNARMRPAQALVRTLQGDPVVTPTRLTTSRQNIGAGGSAYRDVTRSPFDRPPSPSPSPNLYFYHYLQREQTGTSPQVSAIAPLSLDSQFRHREHETNSWQKES